MDVHLEIWYGIFADLVLKYFKSKKLYLSPWNIQCLGGGPQDLHPQGGGTSHLSLKSLGRTPDPKPSDPNTCLLCLASGGVQENGPKQSRNVLDFFLGSNHYGFWILTNGLYTPLTQYKHPGVVWELIKLTRVVCLVFLKRQPWVSLADVTLLVGVHKRFSNVWFKRVEDLHQSDPNCKIQNWGPSNFCLKRAERN